MEQNGTCCCCCCCCCLLLLLLLHCVLNKLRLICAFTGMVFINARKLCPIEHRTLYFFDIGDVKATVHPDCRLLSIQMGFQWFSSASVPIQPRCIGDGHPRESFLPTVRTGLGMSAQTGHQRKVEVKLIHQPIHIRRAVHT